MTAEGVKNQDPTNRTPGITMILAILIMAIILMGTIIVSLDRNDGDDDGPDNSGEIRYRSTEDITPKEKHGQMGFDITINETDSEDVVKLWFPYPTSNQYQTIEDVQIFGNHDFTEIVKDSESGTIMLYAEWNGPTEAPTLTYSFNISRTEIIRKNFPEKEGPIPVEIEKYLLPSARIPINGTVKKETDKAITDEDTILRKAIAIYDYIVENGVRDPTIIGCGDGNPCDSIEEGISGKCADIHSVFVAMARCAGVPAREIFGTRISKDGDITGNYHCRAEFYLPGYGWVPVDPSDVRKTMLKENLPLDDSRTNEVREYYFGAQTETYVDFYSGRDITLCPAQSSGPVNYFMYPFAEVNGEPLDHLLQQELQYHVRFQEHA